VPDAPERAAPNDFQGRYLSHLEKENVLLREQNTVLLEHCYKNIQWFTTKRLTLNVV